MITFSRKLAQQLRAVMRRAFGGRGAGPAVCFAQGPDGLRVRASHDSVAVEYRDPGPSNATADTLWLPFAALEHFAAKSDERVTLEPNPDNRVTAQWRDKSVPQLVQYEGQPAKTPLPERPDRFVTNPPRLRQALQDAADTCDPTSARFALGCLQMKPEGTLCATDGGQMLVQRGLTGRGQPADRSAADRLGTRRRRRAAANEPPLPGPGVEAGLPRAVPLRRHVAGRLPRREPQLRVGPARQ